MSVSERTGAGGLWITGGTTARTAPHPDQEPSQVPEPDGAPDAQPLVWRSVPSGVLLSRGRALTQQQAIHACLTHSRNEIIASATTPTRITYRTPSRHSGGADSVTVYEGTRPGPAHPIPPVTPGLRYRIWRQGLDHGEHDLEVWDGTAWTSDLDPAARAAAQAFLLRLCHLDDLTEAGALLSTDRR